MNDNDVNEQAVEEPGAFSDLDRAILEFERLHFASTARRTDEILARFQMTMTGYYSRLNWILEQPEALAWDPFTVRRLQRIADRRRRARRFGASALGADELQ